MSDIDTQAQTVVPPARQLGAWRRMAWPLRALLYGVALVGLIGLIAWTQREDIARNLIGNALDQQGIPARYDIESIGVGRQVVRNLVIGDPRRPDATIDRLTVDIGGGLFGLTVNRAEVDGLRAYGRWSDGQISFGSLDRLLYTDSAEPFSLPRLDLDLRDARVRIDSPYGAVGIKADGSGNLQGGFKGSIAVLGKQLRHAGCTLDRVSLYGAISVTGQRPAFDGPMRFDALACAAGGLRVARSAMAVRATTNRALDRLTGSLVPAAGGIRADGFAASALTGTLDFSADINQLDARIDLRLAGAAASGPSLAALGFDGWSFGQLGARGEAVWRMADAIQGWSYQGQIQGDGLQMPAASRSASLSAGRSALDEAVAESAALPIAPLVARIVTAARKALPGARLLMDVQARGSDHALSLQVPRLALTGARGDRLISGKSLVLRTQNQNQNQNQSAAGAASLHLAGIVTTGGEGLPRAQLEIASPTPGSYTVRAKVERYAAGDAALALPNISAVWNARTGLAFTGQALLSGPLPGGAVQGLVLPLQGRWSKTGGLALFDRCETLRFDRLQLASLTAQHQMIRLCPAKDAAMVRSGPRGLQASARLAGASQIRAQLGNSPMQLGIGAMQLDYPGSARLSDIDLIIGDPVSGTHVQAGDLSVELGQNLGGRFSEAQATIGAVPLMLTRGSGSWRFADSVLGLSGDEWLLRDRQVPARFQPLVSTDMQLTLADGRIAVTGTLDEPQTARNVLRIAIAHDLGSFTGQADLFVDRLTFDDQLQPEMVTNIALGVIANTRGSVAGTGRIAWSADGVTASTGQFRTDSLDFAAAFGPVRGLSGEIIFTDLLGMETGPGQVVRLAEVNPGFAVANGTIRYQLLPDFRMQVEGGQWPFAGGRLLLDPGPVDLVSDQPRSLVFRVDRVDAAQFLAGFDFENINATGHFAGIIPIVFDQNGAHVRGGRLEVVEDGGTLAYVGELTYEDLGTMANFAFNALRSLRYRYLIVEMDGDLAGEVVTRIRFDGLSQGQGASRNFLTRQVEKLPLQFNVTISAPFLQLITSARSLYDTQYVTDPELLGLLPGQANNPGVGPTTETSSDQPGIQPPESEDRP